MDAETVYTMVMSLVILAILAAMTVAIELVYRTEPGTPVVVEREDGDGRTALVLDYEGEHYVLDIREDDLDERR